MISSPNNRRDSLKIIVPGAICTDITVSDLQNLPQSGEDAYGAGFTIGPGAKSRNIADMTARLTEPGVVAMISRTAKDTYGLWNVPYKALQDAGVNVDFVKVLEQGAFPAIALIAVDSKGNRMAAINNSVIDGFSHSDIDAASSLFDTASDNDGMLVLSFEMPFDAAVYAMQKASQKGLKIFADPGGLTSVNNLDLLFQQEIYLLKPNEHETKQLTGVEVKDMDSAQSAAEILKQKGVKHILITHGDKGAYLFESNGDKQHIVPPLVQSTGPKDATGCGDQVMAALCAFISNGKTLSEAANLAVVAGTLQFNRPGIQPVELNDILAIS
jgi:ribokinase